MLKMRKLFLLISMLGALAGLLSGCGKNNAADALTGTQAAAESEPALTEAADFPEAYMIESDNYFDYQPGLECAAFASAYVLRHFGEEADGLELFQTFPNKLADGSGVPPSGIERCDNEKVNRRYIFF